MKAIWLMRGGLPLGMELHELDAGRITPDEGRELHQLTLRAMKGALDASEVPRHDELVEKVAGATPGSIEAHRQLLEQRRIEEEQQAAAEREAQRQREAEREQWFVANGVPRL